MSEKHTENKENTNSPKYMEYLDKSMHHIGSTTTWYDMLSIIGVFLGSSILFSLLPMFFASDLSTALSYVLVFVVTIFYIAVLRRRNGRDYITFPKFSFRRINSRVLLAGMVMMFAVSFVLSPLITLFPDEWLNPVTALLDGGFWSAITAVVIAPILEEFLFRGVIQKSLTAKCGTTKGIVLAAFIFGLVHFIPQQIIYAFALGVVLGFVYYMSGSLITVILLHFINNGVSFLVNMLSSDPMQFETKILGSGLLYYIVYSAAVLLIIGAIFAVVKEVKREKKGGETGEPLHETN